MTLADRRKTFTAIVTVCNASWLQPMLPQILIANHRTVRARDLLRLRETLPGNVHLWREASAWIVGATFERVVDLLGAVVNRHCQRGRAILLMDSHPVHCLPRVLKACLRNRLRVVFIPARCTSLLQPLDTDCFAKLKMQIRKNLNSMILESPSPEKKDIFETVLAATVAAMRKVLQGNAWAKAFERNGFGNRKFLVRNSLLQKLGFTEQPLLIGDLPELCQLEVIFPQGCGMDFDLLLGPLEAQPDTVGAPSARIRRRLSSKTCVGEQQ